jgi:hypothetical protein
MVLLPYGADHLPGLSSLPLKPAAAEQMMDRVESISIGSESAPLRNFLFVHQTKPEFACPFRKLYPDILVM